MVGCYEGFREVWASEGGSEDRSVKRVEGEEAWGCEGGLAWVDV